MKILYAILLAGICQMVYSFPDDDESVIVGSDGEQVANVLVDELQEKAGPNWVDHVPGLLQQIEEISAKLEDTDNKEDDSKYLDAIEERPWMTDQIIMRRRWKKIFNKVKKAGKKVLGSAAASIAGKVIAGAITG